MVERKNFASPDEVREFPQGRLELVTVGGVTVGRFIGQPGWRWSTSVKPTVQTSSCQAAHLNCMVSGVLKVVMDDGQEVECRPGDVVSLPPGHDAWVVGSEPVVLVDFQGMRDYAKPV